MTSPKGVYTRDEVNAILARAIERQYGDHMTHDDLLATAREAGVSMVAVEAARRELLHQVGSSETTRRARERMRRAFYDHAFTYAVVISFLLMVNLISSRGYLWAVWPALAWAVGLAFHARAALWPSDERLARFANTDAASTRTRVADGARVLASSASYGALEAADVEDVRAAEDDARRPESRA
jgi:hypothetical protein